MPRCSLPASVTAIRKVEGWYARLRAPLPFTCSCPVQGPCLRCMEASKQALAQPLPATVSASFIGGHSLAIAGASTLQPTSCRTLKSLNISSQMPRCSSPASVTAIRKVEGWYARGPCLRCMEASKQALGCHSLAIASASTLQPNSCRPLKSLTISSQMPRCSSPASVTAIRKVEGWYARLRATLPFTCSCPVQGPCLRCMEASCQALAQPLPATVSASFIGSH